MCLIIEIFNFLVKVYRHTWWSLKHAFLFVLEPSLMFPHVLETELANVEHTLLSIFLWVRTVVPSVDLVNPEEYFLNVPYLGRLLMSLL